MQDCKGMRCFRKASGAALMSRKCTDGMQEPGFQFPSKGVASEDAFLQKEALLCDPTFFQVQTLLLLENPTWEHWGSSLQRPSSLSPCYPRPGLPSSVIRYATRSEGERLMPPCMEASLGRGRVAVEAM